MVPLQRVARWPILLALILLAGCVHPAPLKPTATSTLPDPVPNFTGDWSLVPGTFSLARVRTHVLEHDAATNESVARTAACRYPYSHKVDLENHTITAGKRQIALHPYDPGNLRVLFSHELVWDRPACAIPALYGVNENATSPQLCLWGLAPAELQVKVPWRCHLPVEPFNNASAKTWTNVSITLDADAPNGYTIGVNGRTLRGDENATWTTWVRDAQRPIIHEVKIEVQAFGPWPFSSIRRT